MSTTGQKVSAKVSSAAFVDCCCPLKYAKKIEGDRQKQLRHIFYNLADWSQQSCFIAAHIKVCNKLRQYSKCEHSRRSHSKQYHLMNEKGVEIRVCKNFFKRVLNISDGRISRVTSKKCAGAGMIDRMGTHCLHNKTPQDETEYV